MGYGVKITQVTSYAVNEEKRNVGLIAGSAVGGTTLLLVAVVVVICVCQR